jgi:hypothetical protein
MAAVDEYGMAPQQEPEYAPVSPVASAPPEWSPNAKGQVLNFVVGKPVSAWGMAMVPASYGKTTLQLMETRVSERTRRPIIRRDCSLLLTEIDSGEIATHGNPLWIALGAATIAMFGLGIIFIILFFFLKHRFLVIRSHSGQIAVALKGDATQYQHFLDAVLSAAEAAKRGM